MSYNPNVLRWIIIASLLCQFAVFAYCLLAQSPSSWLHLVYFFLFIPIIGALNRLVSLSNRTDGR